jgi:hypothetical protein
VRLLVASDRSAVFVDFDAAIFDVSCFDVIDVIFDCARDSVNRDCDALPGPLSFSRLMPLRRPVKVPPT